MHDRRLAARRPRLALEALDKRKIHTPNFLFAECSTMAHGKKRRTSPDVIGRPDKHKTICRVHKCRRVHPLVAQGNWCFCHVPRVRRVFCFMAHDKCSLCRVSNIRYVFHYSAHDKCLLCRVPDEMHIAKVLAHGKRHVSGSASCALPLLFPHAKVRDRKGDQRGVNGSRSKILANKSSAYDPKNTPNS